ncbi:hypothetical protein GCM10009840_11170 [Pseudolysinimonas kribbensis]|uniref:SAM-dependent methyltransferase n=1 Tax=Pseudolysinimonas kribbensis TaxID=433641 RepID=A0ABQ6K4K0_9MICO|nr:SAM-dependent methyltransferase [Pseudolysinimonas kribbensis]GMA95547.1 hypothetical protein GCM10025881_23710 [Pseudolysinimonas kribbensis]
MSAISLVTPDWLALRGPADDAARSAALAARAARLLPAGPLEVHDLGSGTGAMMRWLAPRLPGPQTWVLHDGDPGILAHVGSGFARDADGRPVTVRTSVEPLAELDPAAIAGAALVTASALLDVVTADEARRIVAACVASRAPALFSLSVTGRIDLHPVHPLDAELEAAFDEHQRRIAAGRRLLGPDAGPTIARLFADAGWPTRAERTPWRLGPADAALVEAWLDGWIVAAVEQRPELSAAAIPYRARRLAQLAAGALRVDVHHEDLLAWPA